MLVPQQGCQGRCWCDRVTGVTGAYHDGCWSLSRGVGVGVGVTGVTGAYHDGCWSLNRGVRVGVGVTGA